ncbi:coiled-coil domain-containing protein 154-like isoform X2 [Pomacea canaliculata]|uniref:coiled-coil domain-containing protein 154-like isoform X2 n=1 Tax=Pomacea canaliculata TaxID=400727 RepID=UPI000D73EE18|nr:coiled-coil domain-containing protein 154-like isoform X2 [Pomacea canaliculata]
MTSRLSYPFATDLDLNSMAVRTSSTQFRGKTSQLPLLPTATPPPGPESQLVPYGMFRGKNSPAGIRHSADILESEEKLRLLETRLGLTEKSNRSLLEEVLRLQNDLRISVVRNEQSIRDEKQARIQLDSSLNIVNDLITQLAARIKTAEEKILEEKSTLSSLVQHTKGVEQTVLASQQELKSRKDVQGNKLLDLQSRLNETLHSKEQVEKNIFTLTEELRSLRNKVENQQAQFSTVVADLRLRSRRLEEENKLQLDALRKQGDLHSHTEQNASHLRGQVETRLTELRDVILELRSRQDAETSERRSLESLLQQKTNELQMAIAEQARKREEAMHALDMIHREKEHSAETEKLKLQSRVTELVEEMNKRVLNKEIKLREEIQDKYMQMEKLLQMEQEKRAEHERKMMDQTERQWQTLKKMGDDEMHGVKGALKMERTKNKESIEKLDESISLLEKQLEEQKRQSDKIIAAEIKSRKDHERHTQEQVAGVQEKLQIATAKLQQAIGSISGHLNTHNEKMRKEMKTMLEASEQSTTRAVTDLDVRMQSIKQKVVNLEQLFDGRISELVNLHLNPEAVELNEATSILAQNLREKIESISLWQDVTSQTIRELNQSVQQVPNDIYAVEEKQKLLKLEVESRVSTEAESRIRDVENLKQELSALKQRKTPQAATVEDLQEVQASVRKLAESIQTVKTVLGMKIQSEQKQRQEDVKRLEDDIEELRKMIKPLLPPRMFVKDDNDKAKGRDAENDTEGVNRWSVYNTYRWLTWKTRIMYMKWRKSARRQQQSRPNTSDNKPNTPDN